MDSRIIIEGNSQPKKIIQRYPLAQIYNYYDPVRDFTNKCNFDMPDELIGLISEFAYAKNHCDVWYINDYVHLEHSDMKHQNNIKFSLKVSQYRSNILHNGDIVKFNNPPVRFKNKYYIYFDNALYHIDYNVPSNDYIDFMSSFQDNYWEEIMTEIFKPDPAIYMGYDLSEKFRRYFMIYLTSKLTFKY